MKNSKICERIFEPMLNLYHTFIPKKIYNEKNYFNDALNDAQAKVIHNILIYDPTRTLIILKILKRG